MSTRMTMKQKAYRGSTASRAVLAQRRALRLAARSMVPAKRWSGRPGKQGELKGLDTAINSVTPPAFNPVVDDPGLNTSAVVLNLIQTGTGSWNRIGRKTSLKSLRIRGYAECLIFNNATSDFFGNWLRISVVWDRQPSGGTIPIWQNIFSDTSQTGAETSVPWSQPAFDTMDRFRVIKEMTIQFIPQNTPPTGQFSRIVAPVDEYIRLPDLESNYSGQSSPMTISDINTGALYLYARCLTNSPGDTVCNFIAGCRVRYTD